MRERPARFPWRPERVRVGTVGRPHGLDGAFVVEGPCGWYGFEVGSRLLADGRPTGVRRRAGTDARPLVALEGHDDRDAAEAPRGAALERYGVFSARHAPAFTRALRLQRLIPALPPRGLTVLLAAMGRKAIVDRAFGWYLDQAHPSFAA